MVKYEIEETDVAGFKYNVRKLHKAPNGCWYYAGYGRYCYTLDEVAKYINRRDELDNEDEW